MRLLVALLAVAALAACSDSKPTATVSSQTTTTVADYTAYCAVMRRTDDTMRQPGYGPGIGPAKIAAEGERDAKAPPELKPYWQRYMAGQGRTIDDVNYLKDWTFSHCGFEPTFG